jgi:hypothetical protein
MSGGHDDRHIRAAADLAQQVEAVILAEADVEQDKAGLSRSGYAHEFLSRARRAYREVMLLEIVPQHVAHGRVVVDDENMRSARRRSGDLAGAVIGRAIFAIAAVARAPRLTSDPRRSLSLRVPDAADDTPAHVNRPLGRAVGAGASIVTGSLLPPAAPARSRARLDAAVRQVVAAAEFDQNGQGP